MPEWLLRKSAGSPLPQSKLAALVPWAGPQMLRWRWPDCVQCTNIAPVARPRGGFPCPPLPPARPFARSSRLGLRATAQQETVLRRAAELAHKSLTDFVLDAACREAEQTLLDQRLFMASGKQYQAFLDLLERPESDNPGVADLFSRQPVWTQRAA